LADATGSARRAASLVRCLSRLAVMDIRVILTNLLAERTVLAPHFFTLSREDPLGQAVVAFASVKFGENASAVNLVINMMTQLPLDSPTSCRHGLACRLLFSRHHLGRSPS
jgi:hypothetical protein